ncbi:MAG: transcriptional regulator [Gammaproteobacteria bacterium HGW-Gammaproteobacteria-8]|nr:MAG: transcriptional regulator [Gammaproteobacteria bacterium HGW-Gammaproteobacteria-8]
MTPAFGLTCGHCGQRLRIRTSVGAHICLRTLFLQCTNELCGATYRGFVEVNFQYSPSACPSPRFTLPTPSPAMRLADQAALFPKDDGGQIDLVERLLHDEAEEQEQIHD